MAIATKDTIKLANINISKYKDYSTLIRKQIQITIELIMLIQWQQS